MYYEMTRLSSKYRHIADGIDAIYKFMRVIKELDYEFPAELTPQLEKLRNVLNKTRVTVNPTVESDS